MKRLSCFLLILCLAACLCGPALAADTPADELRILDWSPRKEAPAEEPEEAAGEGEEGETAPAEETGTERSGFLYTGLDPAESVGDIIVSNGLSWEAENSCVAERVEIEPGAVVDADHPVVILFSESDTVENGEERGNIRFVSDYDEIIAVVHTNDSQGYLDAEPYVKGLADQLKASGAYSLVLTVSAGDIFGGGFAAAHGYNGEYVPYVMGDIYDFFTWGPNDLGLSGGAYQAYFLSVLCRNAGAVPLAANLTDWRHVDTELYAREYAPAVGADEFVSLYDGVSWTEAGSLDYSALDLQSYALERGENVLTDGALAKTDKGTRVGIFGLAAWLGEKDDGIFRSTDTLAAAQTVTDALRDEGADVVIGIGHTGWYGEKSEETGDGDTNSALVVKNTSGLNAYVSGGSQTAAGSGWGWLYSKGSSMAIVNETEGGGEAIGVMYIVLKDGKIVALCGESIAKREDGSFSGIVPDPEIKARANRCYDRLTNDGYYTVYGETEHFLNGEADSTDRESGGVRANETNLGDLVADSLLWIARQRWEGEGTVEFAICPSVMIGCSVDEGSITLADAMEVFAPSSKLLCREFAASDIVILVNKMIKNIGTDSDTMLQLTGIKCTYDEEKQELATLTIGDTLYYDHGTYPVDLEHVILGAMLIPGDETVTDGSVLVKNNIDLARLWCEYLEDGGGTIYPDEIHPANRIVPEE